MCTSFRGILSAWLLPINRLGGPGVRVCYSLGSARANMPPLSFCARGFLRALSVSAAAVGVCHLSSPIDGKERTFARSRSAATISVIGDALVAFEKESGQLPNAAEWPDALVVKSNSVLDGWGRPLAYRTDSRTPGFSFQLYSIGENGIDEQGGGDDINYGSVANLRAR